MSPLWISNKLQMHPTWTQNKPQTNPEWTPNMTSHLTIWASILEASEEATWGSVIAKQDLISPLRRGSSHIFCWFTVPYRKSTSIFPVSGALQLNISGAHTLRPIISHTWEYSKLLRPTPRRGNWGGFGILESPWLELGTSDSGRRWEPKEANSGWEFCFRQGEKRGKIGVN